MRYLSLFTGIGGFELGIINAIGERADFVAYSEIDKYAIQIYEKHFKHTNFGDITTIIASELPDFDLLVGGFPCQAFSIAGKRRGFDDTRGTLFFDIARILKEKRPRLLLLENVKGLLSHDNGNTFKTIISTLTELGYDLQWQVLNSKNFGVPQNRERVFIIGHLRGTPRPKVFPFRGGNSKTIKRFQGDLSGKGYTSQQDRVYATEGLMGTLPATRTENKVNIFVPVLTPDRIEKRQNGRRFKEDGDPSFTLTGQDKHGVYDGMKIRRLTPKECERLMGFPDDWTKYGVNENGEEVLISDTQRYKVCGNGVVTNVVKSVMEKLCKE